jgi:transposase
MLSELIEQCLRPGLPAELNKLARTLKAWFDKICNFHIAWVSIRALLYAGKPDWRVLGCIVVQ